MLNPRLSEPSAQPLCTPFSTAERDTCLQRLYVTSKGPNGSSVIETADSSVENLAWMRASFPRSSIVEVPRECLLLELEQRFGASIADEAANGLARAEPSLSARTVATRGQILALAVSTLLAAAAFVERPAVLFDALVMSMTAAFVVGTTFRGFIAWIGGGACNPNVVSASDDSSLPVYTLLIPLFREANVLPRLIRSLLLLDYPHDRLDIKLIVESDDFETVAMANSMAGRGPFEVIRVPRGTPRTKPRACNYAFKFARGEFTVIYDAEDRPERDQLRKAVRSFRTAARDVACLQARLNFYNANENWLTRLFALDYALWFDVMLPGLEKLGVPMPLGGTSNHFRTSILRSLGAWDPFNVTEDADLGIRMAQLGKSVAMLDSTTLEEAPTQLYSWLKQRSRWLKGYMQTWLVHMRDPVALKQRTGWRGFFAFQLFLGGSVMAALANPPLWLVFMLTSVFHLRVFGAASVGLAAALSASGLFAGNVVLTWLALIAPKRRGWKGFVPYGLTVTIYWALISIAAYRGAWQLVTRPFHWDKTAHGLSRFGRVKV